MICIADNRPVLQIGRHQVTGYDTDWLREALSRGTKAAQREDFPFIDDLTAGILHYLETKCPLRVLTIEELHARVRRMLEKIGCEAIAHSLPLLAPPITLSLKRAAKEVGNGFELAFFNKIAGEIQELRMHGVEELYFTDTRDCVKLLRGVDSWNQRCDQLHAEIMTFLTTQGNSSIPSSPDIRLTLT